MVVTKIPMGKKITLFNFCEEYDGVRKDKTRLDEFYHLSYIALRESERLERFRQNTKIV